MGAAKTQDLLLRIEELERRLEESDQLIEAIKVGEVDAFAIRSNDKSEVYTLQSGDYAYRVLIEEIAEGALNLTEDGLIVYSNNYFAELIGLRYEKVLGSSFSNFIHQDSKGKFNEILMQALSGRSKGEINLAIGDKVIPVYISLTSLQPSLATVGLIVTDLTEKKRNEQERLQSQDLLALSNKELLRANKELTDAKNFINNVLESTNYGVLSYIAIRENNVIIDFEIRYVNDVAMEQIPLTVDQVLGKRYLTVFPLAKEYGLFARILRVVETRVSELHEVNSPQDRNRWFMVRYVALDDGVTATFVEITDQKKYAKAMEEKNLELVRSNAELASFSYIASHDLQEPLRKIQTFSSLILGSQSENLSPKNRDYFNRITATSMRMQNLIEALLNYSRTNTGGIIFKRTDLNKVVDEVKYHLRELMEENKVTVESSDLPELNVIPLQFSQLFLNIIGNAIKYRRSDVDPQITISAEVVTPAEINFAGKFTTDKYWKIEIKDNGIGFDQQYASRIFELFQRLHTKAEYDGTGIGLAICKKIVENHSGFIHAFGEPMIGSSFCIYLPVQSISGESEV